MRRWFRWRKRRQFYTGPIVLASIFLLVFADSLTKVYIKTPDWAWHQENYPAYMWIIAIISILLMLYFWPISGVLLAAAFIGNIVLTPVVANPFFMAGTAFNLADIYIVSAILVYPYCLYRMIYCD